MMREKELATEREAAVEIVKERYKTAEKFTHREDRGILHP